MKPKDLVVSLENGPDEKEIERWGNGMRQVNEHGGFFFCGIKDTKKEHPDYIGFGGATYIKGMSRAEVLKLVFRGLSIDKESLLFLIAEGSLFE